MTGHAPAAEAHPLTLEQRVGLSPYKLRRWVLTHCWRIRGPLDHARLTRALSYVVERHEPLRMRLVRVPDGVLQSFRPADERIEAPTVTDLAPEGLRAAVAELAERGLNLFRESPLRVDLLRVAPEDQVLVLTIHHMAWDAWSAGVFWRDLWTAYDSGAEAGLPPLRTGYARVADAQAARGPLPDEQLAYWRTTAGEPAALWPATDAGPALAQADDGNAGARLVAARPAAHYPRRLAAFARAARVTAATATTTLCLLAAGQALEQRSLLTCYQYHGRDHAEEWDLIGMFCRRFLLRADLDPAQELGALARRVQRDLGEGAARSAAPFFLPALQRQLAAGTEPGATAWHPALSPITVNIVPGRMRGTTGGGSALPAGLDVQPYRIDEPGPEPAARYRGQLWLIATSDPEPVFYADYDRTVVPDEAAARFADRLARLTDLIGADAAQLHLADLAEG